MGVPVHERTRILIPSLLGVSGNFPVFAGTLATLEIPSSQQVDGLARNNNLTFAD